ncbi:MAG TPA: NADH-quinone oxidoreductase subunit J [Chthoniobacteraceae bacterium]|jgi:NADH-quinone oxidoreductase subunit J|nr:NADH-quinone oxidoreductase subunit J [Chthoniobacteraceae bacterium]
MTALLFWLFSALMLGFAVAVVFNRNPVASALSLVISFVGLAALFVLLDAYFLGVIQVLVYAGAVMVLFLFIIMLLDLKAEQRRKFNVGIIIGGVIVAGLFVAQLSAAISGLPFANRTIPRLHDPLADVHNVGTTLFSNYNLPFQVVGVLLLVATIGVVVLSKRELK